MSVMPRMSSWAIAGVAVLALAACTSPQDTVVDRPPVTSVGAEPDSATPSPPDTDDTTQGTRPTAPETAPDTTPDTGPPSPDGTTEPSGSQPDAAPVTQAPATEPPADDTVPDDSSPQTAPPTETSEPVEESVPTSEGEPGAAPADDDINETSLLAAIIGLLGFSVLLVFAARWMISQDAREDGVAPHPDDDLPSDQMSL